MFVPCAVIQSKHFLFTISILLRHSSGIKCSQSFYILSQPTNFKYCLLSYLSIALTGEMMENGFSHSSLKLLWKITFNAIILPPCFNNCLRWFFYRQPDTISTIFHHVYILVLKQTSSFYIFKVLTAPWYLLWPNILYPACINFSNIIPRLRHFSTSLSSTVFASGQSSYYGTLLWDVLWTFSLMTGA